RDCAGNERLYGAHHLEMSHVVNGPGAIGWFECAIEYWQVIRFQTGCAFDRTLFVHMVDDCLYGGIIVTELPQCRRNGVVNNLDGAASDKFLVLHQRQVGLDPSRVAIHHESDRPSRREYRRLRIAVTVQNAEIDGIAPDAARR